MTYQGIKTMVESIGLPFAYYQFDEGTVKGPPFVCFYYPGDHDMAADNINYARVEQLVIELYTEQFDPEQESAVEEVLVANELVCSRVRNYIDSEHMHMTTYTTEVLINADS